MGEDSPAPNWEAVSHAAQRMEQRNGVEATLDEIVVQAKALVPEFNHVGLCLAHQDGRLETLAATDPWVAGLDEIQSKTGEGPCVEAGLHDEVVAVPRLRHEQRWPAYVKLAVRQGLRSQIGIRIDRAPHDTTTLNLYSSTHDEIDGGSIGVAEHVAVLAGLALGRADLEEQLRSAIGTRSTIGTAVGILMERHGLTRRSAFNYLVRQSSVTNTKMRVLAAEMVRDHETSTHSEDA